MEISTLAKYVSQELEYTGIDHLDYSVPILEAECIECTLDARYWLNQMIGLLVTVADGRRMKLIVFRNKSNQLYTPNKKAFENRTKIKSTVQ